MSFFSSDIFLVAVVFVTAAWCLALTKAAGILSTRATWRRTVALAGLIGIGSFVAINEIDGLLRAMHPPGAVGSGLLDLFGFSNDPHRSVETWVRWYLTSEVHTGVPLLHPRTVVEWNVFTDTVLLIPAYALFLGVLARRTWAALGQSQWKEMGTRVGIPNEAYVSARGAARLSIALVSIAPLFDTAENGFALAFSSKRIDALAAHGLDPCLAAPPCSTEAPAHWLGWAMSVATIGKWIALGSGFVLLIPSILLWIRLHTDRARAIGRTVRRVRGILVVQVVFFLLMKFNPQTEDFLRGRQAIELVLELVFLVALMLVTWWLGRRITHALRESTGTPWQRMARVALALLIAGAFGISRLPGPRGLLFAAFLVGALALLEKVSPGVHDTGTAEDLEGIEVIPALMAGSYVILAGIFESQAILGLTLFDQQRGFLMIVGTLVVTVVLPSVIAIFAYRWLLDKAAEDPLWLPTSLNGFPPTAKVFLAAGAAIWIAVILAPWTTSEAVGAVALVLIFFTMTTAFVGALSVYVERRPPPTVFTAFGIHRTPVFMLLALWLVVPIVWGLAGKVDYHEVRFFPATTEAKAFLGRDSEADLTGAWDRWVANQPELQDQAVGPRRTVPLVLVSAEGGGIKAAVWTTLVLDCALSEAPVGQRCPVHDGPQLRHVFAASGVSGGSLGLVTFATKESSSLAPEPGSDWVKDILDRDYVSSSLAWQLFVESPRAWLQFDVPMDRAEVLERSWERPWPNAELGGGFIDLFVRDADVPLLLLNGYAVTDGCKFVTTPIDGNGAELASGNCTHVRSPLPLDDGAKRADRAEAFLAGSRVLPDLLCDDQDVRLSTAALLSARFPYVSPSALLHGCPESDRRIQVADGGYLEGTGTGTLLDLWTVLQPMLDRYNSRPDAPACIVPVLLQIGTGYGPTPDRADARVDEGVVPLRGILNVPSGVGVWQMNQAEQAMLQELPGTGGLRGVYLRVAPVAHPGVQAPLGWTLSDTSYGDLVRQLSAESNKKALDDFRSLIPGSACSDA